MRTSSAGNAFWQGLNPYTGGGLNSQPKEPEGPDPREMLDPLSRIENHLVRAEGELKKVSCFWDKAGREVSQAQNAVSKTQNDAYAAENDTPEVDHSGTGRWAGQNLTSVQRSIEKLVWDASTPSYALQTVKSEVNAAASYLSSLDASQLQNGWKVEQLERSIGQFQSKLYSVEQAQSQLESKIKAAKCPLAKSQGDLQKIAADHAGTCVADAAKAARYNLKDLQYQLQQIESQLSWGVGDLRQIERSLADAREAAQQTTSDIEYGYFAQRRSW